MIYMKGQQKETPEVKKPEYEVTPEQVGKFLSLIHI